jgi:hypothetical protein
MEPRLIEGEPAGRNERPSVVFLRWGPDVGSVSTGSVYNQDFVFAYGYVCEVKLGSLNVTAGLYNRNDPAESHLWTNRTVRALYNYKRPK